MAETDRHHTFTTNEKTTEELRSDGRFSQLAIGAVGSADFGGGTLLIHKDTLAQGLHTIRSITSTEFASLTNKSIKLELPSGTRIVLELTGATSPNLYVEYRNQDDGC